MKRFGFNAFIVDDENRVAFGACRGVARLETEAPVPIVLVGEHGCGKTHLLCAIANDVRTSLERASIACVSADHFPDEIRKLVDDPRPVDRAEKAVLLVDDLDRFDTDLQLLGKIARLFVENDHSVVFASRVHPDGSRILPQALRGLLEKARIIEIGAGDTHRKIALVERRIRQDSEETAARQHREIDDLKARLNQVYPGPEGVESESGDVQLLRECIEELRTDLSESRERLTKKDEEIEDLRAEKVLLSKTSLDAEPHLGPMNEDAFGASAEGGEEFGPQLEAARVHASTAREEAQEMLRRAEELTEQMQENRNEFLKAQEEQTHQLSEIERLENVFAGREGDRGFEEEEGTAGKLGTSSQGDSGTEELEELQTELVAVREERDTLQGEREQLQASIVRAHSERDTMKSLLERVRNELDETRRDLEGVKQGGAERAQTEEARTEALRQSLDASRTEYLEQIAAQRAAGDDLMALHAQLVEASEGVERLVSLLGVCDADGGVAEGAAALPEPDASAEIQEHTMTSETRDSENAILRPDFGEGARQSSGGPPMLHHVEELRSRPEPAVGSTEENAQDEELGPPQSHHKSA